MSADLRIAVQTPVLNRPEEMARLSESVLPELEPGDAFVIIDDGSEPPLDLAAHPQLRIVRHPINRGLLAARNSLTDNIPTDADWVVGIGSDDVCVPGWRSMVADAIAEHPEASTLWFDRAHDGVRSGRVPQPGCKIARDDLLSGRVAGEFTVVARAAVMRDYYFDERAWAFEGALWLRAVKDNPGVHIPEVLAQGPLIGSRSDSASRWSSDPARAAALARGAMAYLTEAGPDFADRFPEPYAELVVSILTWRLLAGEVGAKGILRRRDDVWSTRQRPRWLRLLGLSLLPRGARNAAIDRYFRTRQ